tara:strand:- start:464 stop:637 length:174 start_codon:yes stop_codon:yes gene_type:complete
MNKVIVRAKVLLLPFSSKKTFKPFKIYAIKILIKIGAKIPPKKYRIISPMNKKNKAA